MAQFPDHFQGLILLGADCLISDGVLYSLIPSRPMSDVGGCGEYEGPTGEPLVYEMRVLYLMTW